MTSVAQPARRSHVVRTHLNPCQAAYQQLAGRADVRWYGFGRRARGQRQPKNWNSPGWIPTVFCREPITGDTTCLRPRLDPGLANAAGPQYEPARPGTLACAYRHSQACHTSYTVELDLFNYLLWPPLQSPIVSIPRRCSVWAEINRPRTAPSVPAPSIPIRFWLTSTPNTKAG